MLSTTRKVYPDLIPKTGSKLGIVRNPLPNIDVPSSILIDMILLM